MVVRFAGDGSERKLMADYAPLEAAQGAAVSAAIIDGKAVAARVRERVARARSTALPAAAGPGHGARRRRPGLGRLRAHEARGLRPRSGIESFHHEPGGDVPRRSSPSCSRELNDDERVHGILLQLPLPDHLDQDELISLIDPAQGRGRADRRQRRGC